LSLDNIQVLKAVGEMTGELMSIPRKGDEVSADWSTDRDGNVSDTWVDVEWA